MLIATITSVMVIPLPSAKGQLNIATTGDDQTSATNVGYALGTLAINGPTQMALLTS